MSSPADPHLTVRRPTTSFPTLVTWWTGPACEPDLGDDTDTAQPRARSPRPGSLDDERCDEWLAGWASGRRLWVPSTPRHHPGDRPVVVPRRRRRLGERVTVASPVQRVVAATAGAHRAVGDPSKHSASPTTARGRARVAAVASNAATHDAAVAGRQIHRLVPSDGEWRIDDKIVVLPQLAAGTENVGFLL